MGCMCAQVVQLQELFEPWGVCVSPGGPTQELFEPWGACAQVVQLQELFEP